MHRSSKVDSRFKLISFFNFFRPSGKHLIGVNDKLRYCKDTKFEISSGNPERRKFTERFKTRSFVINRKNSPGISTNLLLWRNR
ncbi:unnamed protein product, partial [Arabidopsis halleri]